MGLQVADLFATLGLKPDDASWRHGDKLIENVKHGLEAFVGVEAVRKIGEMIDQVVSAAVGAERLSQKVGATTASIQELGFAADVSGASTEDLQVSLQHLARGLEEMRTKGTGPAVDGLHAIGASAQEIKNKSPDEVLMTLADHFKAMPDGARKTAAAMDLFGRSGTTLIPMLNRGSEGIADLRKEAEELGVVIDEKGIKSAEAFEESQKRLHATLTGLKNQAVEALLPVLQKMVDGVMEWVKANRELITDGLKAAVEALVIVFKVFAGAIEVVATVLEFLKEHGELARAVLIAIGTVLGALAVEAAAAWVASLAPILLVVAAITGIILVIQDLMKALLEGKGVIATVLHFIGDQFKGLYRGIKGVFESISAFFKGIADGVKNAFIAVIDWISDKIDLAWAQVKKLGHVLAHPIQTTQDFFGDDDTGSGPVTSPSQATRSVSTQNSAPVTNVDARSSITVNASGVDPGEMSDIAKKEITKHHDQTWRDVDAAGGGADLP